MNRKVLKVFLISLLAAMTCAVTAVHAGLPGAVSGKTGAITVRNNIGFNSRAHQDNDSTLLLANISLHPAIPGPDRIKPKLPNRSAHSSTDAPFRLRCDWSDNPLGVQQLHPRLTWSPPRRDTLRHEAAYQIQVANSPEDFAGRHDRLWDSGKVVENPDFLPQYNGPAFKPYTHYYWRVRVWSRSGWESHWSRIANWMTGPLKTGDWRGHWISYHPDIKNAFYQNPLNAQWGLPRALSAMPGAFWILARGAAKPHSFNAPVGLYVLSRNFTLPKGVAFSHGELKIAADNRSKIAVNGHVVMPHFGAPWAKPATLDVTADLRAGKNKISVLLKNEGTIPNPAGLVACLTIQGSHGFAKQIVTNDQWSAIACKTGVHWLSGAPKQDKAAVLAPWGSGPWGLDGQSKIHPKWEQTEPCPIFRKIFHAAPHLKSAYLYIAAPGYWKVRINGHKVGRGELESSQYDYSKTVPYRSFDVTALLRRGRRNVITVALGNGWYNVMEHDVWGWQNAQWRAWPRVRLNLLIQRPGDKARWVDTNNTWQAAPGPRLADGVYNGEVYDPALKIHGWNNPHQPMTHLAHAKVVPAPAGRLTAQLMPPCAVIHRFSPVAIYTPKPHVFVVKFPQNISGWVTLKARGRKGVPVVLRYSERLFPNGLVDRNQISGFTYTGPFQADTYVPTSDKSFTYHPNFSYSGFQYVEINGLRSRKDILNIQADFIHTAFHRAGVFWCANSMLNAIADATNHSYCSNFMGYPTDCPTREKNGWTGDAWLAAVQGMMTYNNQLGYAKWLNDFRDAQQPDGRLYLIIPTPNGWGNAIAPDWDSAYEFVAWDQFLFAGDGKILREHYDGIKKYFLYIFAHQQGWVLGDWATSSRTPPSVFFTSTCILYHDAILLGHIAHVLGKPSDATLFSIYAGSIQKAFNVKYYKGHGVYGNGGQTACAMPLYYGLVPAKRRAAVIRRLVDNIHAHHDHLDVGILGDKCLFRVLSRYGHTDLAYRVATRTTYPGYGTWIVHGATTLYEEWNRDLGSRNHIMFGDILGWMYNDLAGIRPDWRSPGFRTILIKPHPVKALAWAGATYDSRFGTIRSGWRWRGRHLVVTATIPAASSGIITLPGAGSATILCNEKLLEPAPTGLTGVTRVTRANGIVVVHIGPGQYHIVYAPHDVP